MNRASLHPMPSRPHAAPRRHRGVTLIELMVSLVIGLLLIGIASGIYLYSKRSYNAASETAQMEENGRFAIDVLTKYIQSAGFAMVDRTAPGAILPLEDKISGCAYGFVNASAPTALSDLACRTATPTGERPSASLFTRFETDAPLSGSGRQQGFGCTNAAAASKMLATGTQSYEVRSYFFVSRVNVQTPGGTQSMGQLGCVSDSTSSNAGVSGTVSLEVQPLVPGIEQLAIRYMAANGQFVALPTTPTEWSNVTALELCVLARSIQPAGNDTRRTYTDCYGSSITVAASESYRILRSTVALRNTAAL